MMDKVAQRLANRASELRGVLTDTPYAPWNECTEAQREFWKELARVSQEGYRWVTEDGKAVLVEKPVQISDKQQPIKAQSKPGKPKGKK